jgi:NADH-quinone oxidoreductase subunit G
VGALTSGAYRYKARPWEIQYVSTTCAHCGDGCKTTLSVRNQKVLRGNNRDHSGINGEFLCIKGRYGYDYIEHPERLKRPLVRKSGVLTEVGWDEALHTVAVRWRQILDREMAPPRAGFGVIGSNHTTNEASYLLQRFAHSILKTNNIDHRHTADYPALMRVLTRHRQADAPLQLASSGDLKTAPATLLIGSNLTEQHPLLAWNIREAVRLQGSKLYIIHSRNIALLAQCRGLLAVRDNQYGTAIEFLAGTADGKALLGTTPGGREVSASMLSEFREKLSAEQDLIVVLGPELSEGAIDQLVSFRSKIAGKTRYIALSEYSNSRGAADMGLLPDMLPGYLPVAETDARQHFESAWGGTLPAEPGLALSEMLHAAAQGNIESLYVVGSNPLANFDGADLSGKSFVVVQDLFLHETARIADVVLPAASAYECNGTVTNSCGEIQARRKALELPGARADADIICDLAQHLGATSLPRRPDDLFREIIRLVPGYGISPATVLAGGSARTVLSELHARIAATAGPEQHGLVFNDLFTSGTMGRYSNILKTELERQPRSEPAPL